MAFLCDLVNWTEGWSLGKRKGIEAENGSNAETASREDGRPAGWYFCNVFRLQYDSRYFIFNKVWVTHLYFFDSLSWLKFENNWIQHEFTRFNFRQMHLNMMMNVPYTTEWHICLFIRIFISQWVIKM